MDKKPHKPSKQELLRELESIRDSLVEEGTTPKPPTPAKLAPPPLDDDDDYDYELKIPAVAPAPTPEPVVATPPPKNVSAPAPMKPLPGQQSLFDEAEASSKSPEFDPSKTLPHTPAVKVAEKPENPFLPKHIKEKLEKERSLYQQEINASVQWQTAKQKPRISNEAQEKLIDELVESYLPKIRDELRRRLRASLQDLQD